MGGDSRPTNSKKSRNNQESVVVMEPRKLPLLWKGTIFLTLGVLTLGELVYSMEIFEKRRGICVPDPSEFDIFFQDLTTVAGILLAASLVMGLQYLEKK